MNEEDLKKKIIEHKEQLKEIEHAETMVKNQIISERQNPPTDSTELEEKHRQAKADLEEIQNEIKSHKSKAAELKDRITNMKEDFEQTPAESRPENWTELSKNIKPLSDGIIESESAISALEMRRFAAEQAMSQAEIALEAFKAGYHEKPIEEDPRLKAVIEERDRVACELKKAQA